MVLARNPSYFLAGVPLVDKVIIDFNVSDHLQVQRVEAGALDLGGNLVTANDFLSLKNDAKWSHYLAPAPDIAVNYLAFNLNQKPFKGNLKLRQAINMAINKPFILRLLNGRGIVMNGVLPPTMPGANPSFTYYAYDPAQAATLLRAAGYKPGQLTIPLTYQQSGDFDKVAQEIQSELGSIGITIKLKPVSANTWYGSIAYTQKEGPLVLAPWGQDYPDPSDFFDPILSCNGGSNAAFYCNAAVDKLGNQARGLSDSAKRYALYRQMEKLVMADAPWVPLYDGVLYDFHGTRLQGFYIPPVWPFNYADYAVSG
jgi:ABC-type transport system substrate-binding protein